jgi:predicted regulator of Ras-like GTPase activity (Roadblock/LC7/MglB family)
MDLRQPLAELVSRVPGATGAILVDSDGEAVVVYAAPGQRAPDGYTAEERVKLIGAYHMIALRDAEQLSAGFGYGPTKYLVHRYEMGTVVTKPLSGGYALMLVLQGESYVGQGLLHLSRAGKIVSEDL